MKNKDIRYYFLSIVLIISSCSDFSDMNVDPNNPSEAYTDLLLSSALTSMSDVGATLELCMYSTFPRHSIQKTPDMERISLVLMDGMLDLLNDCQAIIDNSSTTVNYKAAARITKAYFMHMMTDRWGMLPYTEALQGANNFQPAYDSQETIYKGLINDLTEAITLLIQIHLLMEISFLAEIRANGYNLQIH